MNKKVRNAIVKWAILAALCCYTVIVAVWATDVHSSQRLSGVIVEVDTTVRGAAFLSPEAVKRELGNLAYGYGQYSLSDVDIDSLERRLNRINNFEHVECAMTSQGNLLIRVTPMIPEIRVFTSKGSYYVNRDGKRMDAHAEYFADLPVVYGEFSNRMPAKGVLPVTRYIAGDTLLKNLVSMIEYRSPRNIYIIPRIKGHVVNIGDTTRLKEKFDNLLLMYRKVMPCKGWQTYDTISVKYAGQIVATRRDKSSAIHSNVIDNELDIEEQSLPEQQLKITGNETAEEVAKQTQQLANNPSTTPTQ